MTNALSQALGSFARQAVNAGGQFVRNAVNWANPPALSPISEPQRSSLFEPGAIRQAVNNIVSLGTIRPQLVRPFSNKRSVQAAQITRPTSTPFPTPTPAQSQSPAPIRITIPASSGEGTTVVPPKIAQAIFQAFEPYKEATNAAQVLHHPMQVSGTPQEIRRGINWWGNVGENPSFSPTAINRNKGGSVDTGLFQINNNTFNGMAANSFWRQAMARRGITSYEQMKDPYKNAQMAMLILMRGNFESQQGTMKSTPNYSQWYGAPQQLRTR